MFSLGEGIFSGFFEDDTTKKPVPAAAIVLAPATVLAQAAVPVVAPVAPVVAPVVPGKAPEEPLSNEIIPVVVVTEAPAPLAVIPVEVEVVAPTDEKVAEQTPELEVIAPTAEKIEAVAMAETANEIIPVVEGEILEPAASEIIVAELPVTQAAVASETPVVATTPIKATSAEEEGLIEGIVNTLIDDGTDGEL